MNKNIPFFKKLKLFKQYKRSIKLVEKELFDKFFIRKDRSHRIYTVLNIPEDFIGESYSIKTSDINKISENFTKEYTIELSKFLDQNGLREMYEVYEIKKVEKYSYLIVIGFSLFKSNKFYDNLYYKVIPISIVSLILSILFFVIL